VICHDATDDPPKTFREFVETKPWRGLGETVADIETLLADDAEALALFSDLVVAGKGGQQENGNAKKDKKTKHDNIMIRSDLFTAPETPSAKAKQGTSRIYTVARLKREEPELFARVVAQCVLQRNSHCNTETAL